MTSPAPMTAAALMNQCLRANRSSDQRLPGCPPRPAIRFFSAISAPLRFVPGGRQGEQVAAAPGGVRA